jgi:hypothetical protein
MQGNKLAQVSLAASLLMVFAFVCAIALVRTSWNSPDLIRHITAITWLTCVPASLGFALASFGSALAQGFEGRRVGASVTALLVASVSTLFCTLQILV